MDRGAWRAAVHGVAESDMTEWLNNISLWILGHYHLGHTESGQGQLEFLDSWSLYLTLSGNWVLTNKCSCGDLRPTPALMPSLVSATALHSLSAPSPGFSVVLGQAMGFKALSLSPRTCLSRGISLWGKGIRTGCACKSPPDLKRVGVTVSAGLGDPEGDAHTGAALLCWPDRGSACWDQLEFFLLDWVHLHKLWAPRKKFPGRYPILC